MASETVGSDRNAGRSPKSRRRNHRDRAALAGTEHALPGVESQLCLALLLVGTVAVITMIRKDRQDFATEVNRLGRAGHRTRESRQGAREDEAGPGGGTNFLTRGSHAQNEPFTPTVMMRLKVFIKVRQKLPLTPAWKRTP